MIKVTIFKDHNGLYKGFRSDGHAGYAERGQDIICAAVSVLVINTTNSIEEFTEDKVDIKYDEEIGLIELNFLSEISKESVLLVDSMILGLQGIINDNGSEYISIEFKEV